MTITSTKKEKTMGDGDVLRCLAKHLVYYPPNYRASALCDGCYKGELCKRLVGAIRG